MENKKHTKLRVTKRKKLGLRPQVKMFIPKHPISKKNFLNQIREIKDEQIFKVQDKEETIFVIGKYEEAPIYNIEKIIEEKWNGRIILFLTETEILVKISRLQLESVIDKFFNKDKKLYDYIKNNIVSIRPLSLSEKISKSLGEKIEKTNALLKVTGLLMPGFSKREYSEIIKQLQKKYSLAEIKASPFMSSSTLTFQALVDKKSLKDIAKQPYIYLFSEPQKIKFDSNNPDSTSVSNNIEIKNRKEESPDKSRPEVCVLDSGYAPSSIDYCISLKDGHPTLDGDFSDSYYGHGTEVSSVAAFADNLIFHNNIKKNKNCNIISYKLADFDIVDPLFSSLHDAIRKFKSRTRIFNISATYQHYNELSNYFTNEIDKLVQSENVILVNSSGNITIDEIEYYLKKGNQYPDYLDKFACRNPSNGKNILSVGSYAYKDNSRSLCKKYQISPFCAKAKIPEIKDKRIKPDLFAVGGNLEKDNTSINRKETLGTPVITIGGKRTKRNGTSFSAPYISHILTYLDKIYSPQNVETLKAMLISCCNFEDKKLKLLKKRDEIFYSKSNDHILLYAEGILGLKKWKKDIKRFIVEYDTIRFYVPIGVTEIRIVIAHSDNSSYFSNWENSTVINADIIKPSRKSKLTSRDASIWHFDEPTQIQFAIFNYKKGETGDWYVRLRPGSDFIKPSERENIQIRYGLAINLIIKGQQKITEDPYEVIKEKLEM